MMLRYRPSSAVMGSLTFILLAVLLEILVLTPWYDATFAEHRRLKEQLKTIEQQLQNPLTEQQTAIHERLTQDIGDDQATLQELDGFRAAARLDNVTYNLGPWQPAVFGGRNYQQQRLELNITSANDIPLWQFIRMVTETSRHLSHISQLRITRGSDTAAQGEVRATLVITFYHLGDA